MPRSFLGHPLTTAPQPLDRAGRQDAKRRLEASELLNSDPDLFSFLVEMNLHLARIAHHASRPAHRRVLYSGLAQLDNTGVWSKKAGGGIASGALWVHSPYVPLIVTTGNRMAAPPNQGPGVFLVPAGIPLTLNAHTTEWTLYGNGGAGDVGIPVPAPAAVTDWTYTVTAELTLLTVIGVLTTSAVVGNRYVVLTIRDPAGSILYSVVAAATPASLVRPVVFGVGTGTVPSPGAGAPEGEPLPPLTLQPGSTISTATISLSAGDQWSGIVIGGSEATGPATSSAGALVNVTMFSDSIEPGL